jgi:hypothetical protein
VATSFPPHISITSSYCSTGKWPCKLKQGSSRHFFLLYINDLPQITNENSKIILYADGTSLIIANPNPTNFENNVNKIFQDINRWFDTNLLSLNLDKTHYMQFINKNSSPIDLNIGHGNKKIANTCNTKFLGLTLENTLSWKTQIRYYCTQTKLSHLCN